MYFKINGAFELISFIIRVYLQENQETRGVRKKR